MFSGRASAGFRKPDVYCELDFRNNALQGFLECLHIFLLQILSHIFNIFKKFSQFLNLLLIQIQHKRRFDDSIAQYTEPQIWNGVFLNGNYRKFTNL
jgi:hypothetical protein